MWATHFFALLTVSYIKDGEVMYGSVTSGFTKKLCVNINIKYLYFTGLHTFRGIGRYLRWGY